MSSRLAAGAALLLFWSFGVQAAPARAWRNLTWGMSPKQVLASLKGEAVTLPAPSKYTDGEALAGIEKYAIAGVNLRVNFVFKDAKLVMIEMSPVDKTDATAATYDSLESLLTEKYGQPVETKRDKSMLASSRMTTWRAEGVAVKLSYMQIGHNDSAPMFSLAYRPPGGSAADKL